MQKALSFQELLAELVNRTSGDTVSVRELLDIVGRRSYGPVLLLLGFVAVSPLTIVPGANWLVALVTLVFSVQIVLGLSHPWVPKPALDAKFPRKLLLQASEVGKKWAYTADQLTKPRLPVLTAFPFVNIAAVVCVAASLLTFPLGLVPFGPLLPGLAVLLFGLGIAARDGAFLLLSFIAFGAGCAVLVRIADRVAGAFGLA